MDAFVKAAKDLPYLSSYPDLLKNEQVRREYKKTVDKLQDLTKYIKEAAVGPSWFDVKWFRVSNGRVVVTQKNYTFHNNTDKLLQVGTRNKFIRSLSLTEIVGTEHDIGVLDSYEFCPNSRSELMDHVAFPRLASEIDREFDESKLLDLAVCYVYLSLHYAQDNNRITQTCEIMRKALLILKVILHRSARSETSATSYLIATASKETAQLIHDFIVHLTKLYLSRLCTITFTLVTVPIFPMIDPGTIISKGSRDEDRATKDQIEHALRAARRDAASVVRF